MSTKNTTVYVSNLSYERDRNGLKSLFSKFGIIKHIKIIVEPSTNQSRGMAFVEMGSVSEAQKAIESLNEKTIDGRTIKANWATPLKEGHAPKAFKFYEKKAGPKKEKDLDFKSIQLAKKARNEVKRKSNPLVFKAKSK